MSQNYSVVNGSDLVKDSREKINKNLEAVASDFSGTAFPTNNLVAGMTCYRTDLNICYRYTAEGTWVIDTNLDIAEKLVTTDDKATQSEAEAGTSDEKYLTPLGFAKAFIKRFVKATQAEAEAGTDNEKVMTPLRVKQSVEKNAPAPVKATQAEAEAGTDNEKVMTPLGTSQSIAKRIASFAAAAVFTAVVKTVSPASSSNDNSVPTTSWVQSLVNTVISSTAFKQHICVSYLAQQNGYVKLGDWFGNLILQWGIYFVKARQSTTYSYPIAFPQKVFSVAGAINSLTWIWGGGLHIALKSKSEFEIQFSTINNQDYQSNVTIIAIGQ